MIVDKLLYVVNISIAKYQNVSLVNLKCKTLFYFLTCLGLCSMCAQRGQRFADGHVVDCIPLAEAGVHLLI